jgi:hypothetical protein
MFTATSVYSDVIFEILCRGRQNKYSELRDRRSKYYLIHGDYNLVLFRNFDLNFTSSTVYCYL